MLINLNSVIPIRQRLIKTEALFLFSSRLSNGDSLETSLLSSSTNVSLYLHSNDLIDHLISDESRLTSTISWVRCGAD